MLPLLVLGLAAALVSPVSDRALRPGQVVPDVVIPEPLTRVRPAVPDVLDRMDVTVVVAAQIGADGRVQATHVVHSAPLLDDAACAALQQWIFEPARDEEGEPTSVWSMVSMHFASDRWSGAGWVDNAPQPVKAPEVIQVQSKGTGLDPEKNEQMVYHVLVDENGHALKAHAVKSTPPLDTLGESVALGTRFVPARNHGRPVSSWTALTLQFRIR